jgi:polyadenylate-binding protein
MSDITVQVPAAAAAPAVSGGKGSSLWVGELASDVNETKLYEFFNPIAAVQSVRVCRNAVTRESLGYAYVNFQTPTDAEAAMDQRNYGELSGKVVRIMWAQRDPVVRRSNLGNVVIKRLPASITDRALHDIFKDFGHILSVKVARDAKGVSKGYGFVHFDSDKAAKDSIEIVNGTELEGSSAAVQVEVFVPRTQRQTAPDKWTNVFVKNIPKSYSEAALKAVFGTFGTITSAAVSMVDGKSVGFGFVNYADHEAAAAAAATLNDKDVETLPNLTPEDLAACRREDAAPKEGEAKGVKPGVKLFVGKALKKVERERAAKEKAEGMRRERQAKFHGCNLYVRNLDDSVDDAALRKEFDPFGAIVSAKVSMEDGRSRGHGFVCFESPEAASKAQAAMNRKLVAGKPLFVALWEAKEVRAARFNATQASAGGFSARRAAAAGGAPGGMVPGGMAGGPGMGGGFNPAMAMMMNPNMLIQGLMSMAAGNPALGEAMRTMSPAAMQQLMGVYLAQVQHVARSSMGGPGMAGGMGSPTGGAGPRGPGSVAGGPRTGGQFPGAGAGFAAPTGAPGMPGAAVRGPAGPRGARAAGAPGSVAPGAMRMGGPAGAAGPRGPMAAGPRGPMAAIVAGGRPGVQAGPRPGMPGAAAAALASSMQYRPADGARNMAAMMGMANMDPAQQAALIASMQAQQVAAAQQQAAAQAAPVGGQTRDQFVQQLASISNAQQRKNMIGEHLYTQVAGKQPALAGKITGMLLDGMEDSELLHLLETPTELDARIAEALDVLEQHNKSTA